MREFGVSNFRPSQITALQRACPMPLIVQQVEISLLHLDPLEDGTLDHCLAQRITPMAWSPLGGGGLGDGARKLLPSQQGYQPAAVNAALDAIARRRGTHRVAVALAWLLRHPAGITPMVGTTDPARIRQAAEADALDLSRDEWYELLRAAQGRPLP